MQTVVLAAGLGTRLSPVTGDRSKAMVPVVGRPLVELAIDPMVKCGLTDFVFVIGPQDFEIRRRFDNKADRDRSVRFVVQEQRLGMAHALAVAAPHLDGPFVLTACDSLIGENHVADLLRAHSGSSAVLSLMEVAPERVCRSAAVELDGDTVRRIVEKPASGEAPSNTVSLPHYILPHSLLDLLTEIEPSPRGEIELQSAIQGLIDRGGDVVGVRTDSRRQVSNPDDLLRLNLEVLRSVGAGHAESAPEMDPTMVLTAPFLVEDGVSLGRNCVIGPNAYLERGCVIGDGAVVRDSVILRNAVVAGGQRVRGELLS
jgi:NDP-sugar pyrophosphorylase family protein